VVLRSALERGDEEPKNGYRPWELLDLMIGVLLLRSFTKKP
jgi:hypothetical protein